MSVGDFVDSFFEARDPSAIAVWTREGDAWRARSYGELEIAVSSLAHRLSSAIGVGDRVLLCALPSDDWIVGFFGILRAGGIVVPISPTITAEDLEAVTAATKPSAIVSSTPTSLGLMEFSTRYNGDSIDVLLSPIVDRGDDEMVLLMATSGTWGNPGLVALRLSNIAYMVDTLTPLQRATADDRWLSVLPLTHMLEIGCVVLPALRSGASIAFAQTMLPDEILRFMRELDITRMMTVPALLGILLQRMLHGQTKPQTLHTLYCGGAPLDAIVGEQFQELQIAVYAGYGLTETSPTVSVNHPGSNRFGSTGPVLPGTDVMIDGDTGELLVRGPGVSPGYWIAPGELKDMCVDGWFHTGDVGSIDEDGYVWISGRIKNLIVLPSGANVQPEKIEASLRTSALWSEVAVSGAHEVVAVVVSREDATTEQIQQVQQVQQIEHEVMTLTRDLASFERPTRVIVIEDPLPRTVKGELDRRALMQLVTEMSSSVDV